MFSFCGKAETDQINNFSLPNRLTARYSELDDEPTFVVGCIYVTMVAPGNQHENVYSRTKVMRQQCIFSFSNKIHCVDKNGTIYTH